LLEIMASKRIFRSAIDWNKFSEFVPKDVASDATYKALKNTSNSLVSKVSVLPENLPEIDWNHYKNRLPNMTSMINDFEQKYKSLKIDYPKAPSDVFTKIDSMEKEYQVSLDKMKIDIEEQQKTIKVELARLEAMPPIEQMSDEDWLWLFPEYTLDPRVRPMYDNNISDPHLRAAQAAVHIEYFRQYGIYLPAEH